MNCSICGDDIKPIERSTKLGITTCMTCGDAMAKEVKHCIVPMAKSNYIVVTDYSLLKGLNKYAK